MRSECPVVVCASQLTLSARDPLYAQTRIFHEITCTHAQRLTHIYAPGQAEDQSAKTRNGEAVSPLHSRGSIGSRYCTIERGDRVHAIRRGRRRAPLHDTAQRQYFGPVRCTTLIRGCEQATPTYSIVRTSRQRCSGQVCEAPPWRPLRAAHTRWRGGGASEEAAAPRWPARPPGPRCSESLG